MSNPVTGTVTESMITNASSYKDNVVTEQTMTVEYEDTTTTDLYTDSTYPNPVTADLKITLADTLQSIKIDNSSKPTEVFKYGDTFSTGSGKIIPVYGHGDGTPVSMSDASVSISPTPNMNTLGDQELTVSYTDAKGTTKTCTYTITVKDYVTGITVKPTSVTAAKGTTMSQVITDNTMTYEVTYAKAGPQGDVTLTADMTDGYSTTVTGAQTVTVTYTDEDEDSYTNGDDFEATFEVVSTNKVSSIEVKEVTKDNYKYQEDIDLDTIVVVGIKEDGTEEEIVLSSDMIDGYDPEETGEQTVTVTYENPDGTQLTDTFKVTVKDYVTGITVKPSNVTVEHGTTMSQVITDNTMTYEVTYAKAGAQGDVTLTDTMTSGYKPTEEGTQTIKVTYTDEDENSYTKGKDFEATFEITVQDTISSIQLIGTPKDEYKYGESLDLSTISLEVQRTSGTETITLPNDSVKVTGYNPTQLGEQTVTLTLVDSEGNPVILPDGATAKEEITVTVKDYVSGVVFTPPTKDTYEYGEDIDWTGASIIEKMASGVETTITLPDSRVTVTGYSPTTEGAQTVKLSYTDSDGKLHDDLTFGVTVQDSVTKIEIVSTPKDDYLYGDKLDVTGGKIKVTKTSGTQTIDITPSMVSGYKPNQLGSQTLTVTYKGVTDTYNVEVKDFVKGIEITTKPKTVYKLNEDLDVTGGKITEIMASGAKGKTVDMKESMISGFSSSTEGARTLTVTYNGHKDKYGITVVDELSDMIITKLPNKTDYLYGESLDPTGGEILITKESGATKTIKMTSSMISGYNPKKLGEQKLKVTYGDKTQEFIVTVSDYAKKINITKPNKTDYEYGEDLNLTGAKVSVVMASGAIDETVDMTASMLTGYDNRKEGKQTITVEYKGFKSSFNVTVTDSIKGISIKKKPDKKTYKYGEDIDPTGGILKVVKTSGTYYENITRSMLKGYKSKQPGTQVITVKYKGFETQFVVKVLEKEENNNNQKTNDNNNNNNNKKKPIVKTQISKPQVLPQETIPTEPIDEPIPNVEENTNQKPNNNTDKKQEEKPTQTLGAKDEKEDTPEDSSKAKALVLGALGILLLLILLLFKRNVKIYVEEDGEFVLAGYDKVKKNDPYIDIDKYLDEETYNNRVKVILSDSISEKLDNKTLEIEFRGEIITHKVQYEDEEYEFILEENKANKTKDKVK